jgi:hypothetical protein
MKCIQRKADLETRRVTDKEAAQVVADGRAYYASRRTWKIQGRGRGE